MLLLLFIATYFAGSGNVAIELQGDPILEALLDDEEWLIIHVSGEFR